MSASLSCPHRKLGPARPLPYPAASPRRPGGAMSREATERRLRDHAIRPAWSPTRRSSSGAGRGSRRPAASSGWRPAGATSRSSPTAGCCSSASGTSPAGPAAACSPTGSTSSRSADVGAHPGRGLRCTRPGRGADAARARERPVEPPVRAGAAGPRREARGTAPGDHGDRPARGDRSDRQPDAAVSDDTTPLIEP